MDYSKRKSLSPPFTVLPSLEAVLFATSQTLPHSPCLVTRQGIICSLFSISAGSILVQDAKISEKPVAA